MCKYSYKYNFTFSGTGKEEYKYITCKGNYLRLSACCSSRVKCQIKIKMSNVCLQEDTTVGMLITKKKDIN